MNWNGLQEFPALVIGADRTTLSKMRVDLADWIALNMIRGIGPRTANLLLDHFGTPANVFAASRAPSGLTT